MTGDFLDNASFLSVFNWIFSLCSFRTQRFNRSFSADSCCIHHIKIQYTVGMNKYYKKNYCMPGYQLCPTKVTSIQLTNTTSCGVPTDGLVNSQTGHPTSKVESYYALLEYTIGWSLNIWKFFFHYFDCLNPQFGPIYARNLTEEVWAKNINI